MAPVKEKVVYASICKKCETVIKEVVSKITTVDIQENLSKTPDIFFEYNDKRHNAKFRSLIEVPCCGRC